MKPHLAVGSLERIPPESLRSFTGKIGGSIQYRGEKQIIGLGGDHSRG